MAKKLYIGGNSYDVFIGNIISIPNDNDFGDWIKITSLDYELVATKIADENDISSYKIESVNFFNKPVEAAHEFEEAAKEMEKQTFEDITEYRNKLAGYKKDKLIELATELDLDITPKMKKSEIIDILVDAYENF